MNNCLVFFVVKNDPKKGFHQIQKVKRFTDLRFHLIPQRYYDSKVHPYFVQSKIDGNSKSKVLKINKLTEEDMCHYIIDGKFIFNGSLLEEEFDPSTVKPIKYQVEQLKIPESVKIRSLEAKIRALSFRKKSCPITFLENYKSIFNGLDKIESKYLVDFIPNQDLAKFSKLIQEDKFNQVEKLFLELYLPEYLEKINLPFNKTLIEFDTIEDYLKSKYELFKQLKCDDKLSLKLSILGLPSNLMIKVSKNGGLSSIQNAIRNSKLLESEISSIYEMKNEKESSTNILNENVFENDKEIFINPANLLMSKSIKEYKELYDKKRKRINESAGRPSQYQNLANEVKKSGLDIKCLDNIDDEQNVKRLKKVIIGNPTDIFKKKIEYNFHL